jgi:hypothetical protein
MSSRFDVYGIVAVKLEIDDVCLKAVLFASKIFDPVER